MNSDVMTILGAVLVVLSVLYIGSWLTGKQIKKNSMEGMENNRGGEGGTAASYAAAIKAKTTEMTDALLVNKYRNDYESALINLDEFIGVLMLRKTLNIDINATDSAELSESVEELNALTSAKSALSDAMKVLDEL